MTLFSADVQKLYESGVPISHRFSGLANLGGPYLPLTISCCCSGFVTHKTDKCLMCLSEATDDDPLVKFDACECKNDLTTYHLDCLGNYINEQTKIQRKHPIKCSVCNREFYCRCKYKGPQFLSAASRMYKEANWWVWVVTIRYLLCISAWIIYLVIFGSQMQHTPPEWLVLLLLFGELYTLRPPGLILFYKSNIELWPFFWIIYICYMLRALNLTTNWYAHNLLFIAYWYPLFITSFIFNHFEEQYNILLIIFFRGFYSTIKIVYGRKNQ